jgi:hypothetical protein
MAYNQRSLDGSLNKPNDFIFCGGSTFGMSQDYRRMWPEFPLAMNRLAFSKNPKGRFLTRTGDSTHRCEGRRLAGCRFKLDYVTSFLGWHFSRGLEKPPAYLIHIESELRRVVM